MRGTSVACQIVMRMPHLGNVENEKTARAQEGLRSCESRMRGPVLSSDEASWSSDHRSGDDYVGPVERTFVVPSERPELSRATVQTVISAYTDPLWVLRDGQFEVAAALWVGKHVVCSFPTSAGKTLIMMLGPLLDFYYSYYGIWIVCQPLEALRNNTVQKLRSTYFARTRIAVAVWRMDGDDPVDMPDDPHERVFIILCSPEQLSSVYTWVQRGRFTSLVRGLMMDEAHLRFDWEFRDFSSADTFSTRFPAAVIGLFSATLSPNRADEFIRLMAMRDVAVFNEARFPRMREMKLERWKQFRLRCASMDVDRLVASLQDILEKLPEHGTVIVFANSYAKLAKLAEPLGRDCLRPYKPRFYCAVYDESHKVETCNLINSGDCRLVAATCALGVGVDLENICSVVFFGCPRSFSDATQGMGRAGRGPDRPLVDVIFATEPSSSSKADKEMRILVGYCTAAVTKKTLRCRSCQAPRLCPDVADASLTYLSCFDFVGVHCRRSDRPACMLTMCMVFDGLLPESALYDADKDCHQCGACAPSKSQIRPGNLVTYKGKLAVVLPDGRKQTVRLQIRETGSSINHTVEATSLTLVSTKIHQEPAPITCNKLSAKERKELEAVLLRKFSDYSLRNFSLLSSVPSSQVIKNISKWTPEEFDRRFAIRHVEDIDMRVWFQEAVTEAILIAETSVSDVDVGDDDDDDDDDDNGGGRTGANVGDGDGPDTQSAYGWQFESQPSASPSLRLYMDTFYGPLQEQLKAKRDGYAAEQTRRQQNAAAHHVPRSSASLGGGAALPRDANQVRRDRSRRATFDGSVQASSSGKRPSKKK